MRLEIVEYNKLEKEVSVHKANNLKLNNEIILLKAHIQGNVILETSTLENTISKYDDAFQEFLKNNTDRSKMASMIYGVGQNGKRGIGYTSNEDQNPLKIDKLIPPFTYYHTNSQTHKFNDARKPRFHKNSGKTNVKGPKNIWVTKYKIVYVAYLLHRKVQTPIMVPGLWMLASHDRKKAYVSRIGA